MLEIIIAVVILAFGVLPIFDLFRQNTASASNNINETKATNFASDLINFCKDLRYNELEVAAGSEESIELANDQDIRQFFTRINQNIPDSLPEPFGRSMTIKRCKPSRFERLADLLSILIGGNKKYSPFPTYLIKVKVSFPRIRGKSKDDSVTLYTIVLD